MVNLTKFKIQAVKESSARYDLDSKKVTSPWDAYKIIKEVFKPDMECEEVFSILTLDAKCQVTGCFEVSRGSLNSSIVHPREVFKRAILANSHGIILTHNHPSGNPKPSKEDENVTKRLQECANIIGIKIIDHVITGDGTYFSFKENFIL